MNRKSALVVGATGLIGGKLLSLILDSDYYSSVASLSRRKLSITHDKLVQHVIEDYDKIDEQSALINATDIYCCLGTTMKKAGSKEAFRKVDYEYPLKIARLAKSNGCENFLLISAMGASADSGVFYNRVKGEIENAIIKLKIKGTHIFRPSLLLGERTEKRSGEQAAIVISKYLSFAFIGPLRKYRPIQADTVAKSMFMVAQRSDSTLNIYESETIANLLNS